MTNRCNVESICDELYLTSMVHEPTLVNGTNTLDYVLLSHNLSDQYSVSVEPPIANSDHKSIIGLPKSVIINRSFFKRTVYDCRHSNVAHFVDCVSGINWNLLMRADLNVDAKCDIFQSTINDCFVSCIPFPEVVQVLSFKNSS